MTQPTRNGLRQDPEKDRAWRQRSAVKAQQKRRVKIEQRTEGKRVVVRRTPLKPVSAARVRENKQRRKNVEAVFGTDPLCVFPDCCRFADDAHEVLSRARGGSITDPANIRPLCRTHHNYVTTHPVDAAALGLSISAYGGAA